MAQKNFVMNGRAGSGRDCAESGRILDVAAGTSTPTGSAYLPRGRHMMFRVVSSAATTVIEASYDGVTYFTLDTTTNTTDNAVSLLVWYPYIRARVTAHSSAVVTVDVATFFGG